MTENEKNMALRAGASFCASTPKGEALGAILEALSARYLGERALRAGDEVLLLGNNAASEQDLLQRKGLQAVSAEKGLVHALSPATRMVMFGTAGAEASALRAARNFCNDFELWLIVDAREAQFCCEFDGEIYPAAAVGDFGIVSDEEGEYIVTRDVQLYRLLPQIAPKSKK